MKVFCTDFDLLVGNSSAEDSLMTSLYLRGDHTLLNSGKRVMTTSWMKGLSYMPQLVVRIDRAGKGFEPRFADRYYRRAAWGVALADRQLVLDRLSQRMDPGVAYSFDGSLAVGDFCPIEELRSSRVTLLETEGATPLRESSDPLPLPSDDRINEVVSAVAQLYLLKTGDCICFPLGDEYKAIEGGHYLFIAEGDEELLRIGIE